MKWFLRSLFFISSVIAFGTSPNTISIALAGGILSSSSPLPLSSLSNKTQVPTYAKETFTVEDQEPLQGNIQFDSDTSSDVSISSTLHANGKRSDFDSVIDHNQAKVGEFQTENFATEETTKKQNGNSHYATEDEANEFKWDNESTTMPMSAKLEVSGSDKIPSAFNISVPLVDMEETVLRETDPTCSFDLLTSPAMDNFCAGDAWSCQGKCGEFRNVPCSCHINCEIYRTCCLDFEEQCLLGMSRCTVYDLHGIVDRQKFVTMKVQLFAGFSGFIPMKAADGPSSSLFPPDGAGGGVRDNVLGKNDESIDNENDNLLVKKSMRGFIPATGVSQLAASNISHANIILETTTNSHLQTKSRGKAVTEHRAVVTARTSPNLLTRLTLMDVTTAPPTNANTNTSEFDVATSSSPLQTPTLRTPDYNLFLQEEIEVPSARCVPAIQALLIDYCPNGTRPTDRRLRMCLSTNPSTLMEVIPVTDPKTGLHFRNSYCMMCWWKYLAKISKNISDCEGDELWGSNPSVSWEAEILVSSRSRPKHDSFLPDILDFLVNEPAAIVWKSPEEHPHHSCKALDQPCFDCNDDKPHLNLCQTTYSYVEVDGIIHSNKLCAACHAANEFFNQSHSQTTLAYVSTNTVVNHLKTLECRVPKAAALLEYTREPATWATLKLDKDKLLWVFENKGVRDNKGTGRVPRESQLSWLVMECNFYFCEALTCFEQSWLKDGRCLLGKISASILLSFCFALSDKDTVCSADLGQFINTDSYFFLRTLQSSVLEILLQTYPMMLNVSKDDVESSLERYQNKTLLAFWLPLEREHFHIFKSPADVTALITAIMTMMQQLALRGWAKVCFSMDMYRRTVKELYESPNVDCGISGGEFVHIKASLSSAGKCSFYLPVLIFFLCLGPFTF